MTKQTLQIAAPELITDRWFNTKGPVTLAALRGRPVLLHTFQMLCPGCVLHAIPQAQKVAAMLRDTDLAVIGLHTVFEHHAAMTPVSLEAFIHEYRITFPVGVDKPGADGPIPQTMAAYRFRGTPSTVLIDRRGFIRHHGFGQEDDIALGLRLGMLLAEDAAVSATKDETGSAACDDGACVPKS
jgi:peroxiredoxin